MKLSWKPFEAQFGEYLSAFRHHQEQVEKEAGLSHMLEAADSRASMHANQQQLERLRSEDDRRRLLQCLSSTNPDSRHKALRMICHPGSGQWLLKDERYIKWKLSSVASGIICHGIPGCGKTVLVSTIIEDLRLAANIVYYYCDHANMQSLTLEEIYGSLLKQLVVLERSSEEALKLLMDACDRGFRKPDHMELEDLLTRVMVLSGSISLLLDGLDECAEETQRSLVSMFDRIFAQRECETKILLTCRSEHWVVQETDSYSQCPITERMLSADIDNFVDESVQERIKRRSLRLRDSGLQTHIVTELVSKAKGMFLWVQFQLDELCRAASDNEVREILADLPEGVGGTYIRILRRISKSRHRSELCRRIFLWVACARRPLRVGELQEAVAIESNTQTWDVDIPDPDRLFEICQGLVIRSEDDDKVRFAHHTVHQFLLEKDIYTQSTDSTGVTNEWTLEHLFLSAPEAELEISKLCLAYLSLSDFETALTKPPTGIVIPVEPRLFPVALGIPKRFVSVAHHVLGNPSEVTVPALTVSLPIGRRWKSKNPSPDMCNKYVLLDYVISFWPEHTKHIGAEGPVYRRLKRLVLEKELPFEFRPWGANQHYGIDGCKGCFDPDNTALSLGRLPYMNLFRWAAQSGHMPLFKIIDHVDAYLSHEKPLGESLISACRTDCTEMVLMMLKSGTMQHAINVVAKAISVLCEMGYSATLQAVVDARFTTDSMVFVLDCQISHYSPFNGDPMVTLNWGIGRNPLQTAAMRGYAKCVDALILLPRFLDLDEWSVEAGWTALHHAADAGHHKIVSKLIQAGSSKELVDRTNETALVKAVNGDKLETVRVLVKAGANVNVGCNERLLPEDTEATKSESLNLNYVFESPGPIFIAAAKGKAEILEALISSKNCTSFNIDRKYGRDGMTALHWACAMGQLCTAAMLIQHSANYDLFDHKNRTAMSFAFQLKTLVITETHHIYVLINRGSPHFQAVEETCQGIIRWVCENKSQTRFGHDG